VRNITLFVLILSAALTAQAELYKWTDKSGGVHYSDQPPASDVKNVERKKIGGNVIEGQENFSLKDAARKFPVTLYANDCGEFCNQARELLTKRGIPFTLKNPEASAIDSAALKKLIGSLEVPTLRVGESSPIKGYLESSWTSALDVAGYPKTNPKAPSVEKAAAEKAKDEAAKKAEEKKNNEEKKTAEKPAAI
jgi:glutaredoxin